MYLSEQPGLNDAGQDRIDRDTVWRGRSGQGLGEAELAALGTAVVNVPLESALLPGNGADRYDSSRALLVHEYHDLFCSEENRVQLECVLPVFELNGDYG